VSEYIELRDAIEFCGPRAIGGWRGNGLERHAPTRGELIAARSKILALSAEAILAGLPGDRDVAARKAFSLAQRHPDSEVFQQAARRLVVTRVRKRDVVDIGIHDVKFPEAIFEDFSRVSPAWQPHMFAASVYWLPGSNSPPSQVMEKARDAVRSL